MNGRSVMSNAITMPPNPVASAQLEPFLADFRAFDSRQNGSEPLAVKQLRQAGIASLAATGFPSTRLEAWRLTDIDPILQGHYQHPVAAPTVDAAALIPHRLAGCASLVLVDGHFSADLSDLSGLSEGVWAGSLAEALRHPELLALETLGRIARFGDPAQAFVALSTAFVRDGAYLQVAPGKAIERPIQVLMLASGGSTVSYPRNLFVTGAASQLTVIETFVSLNESAHFSCPVTEIAVGPAANVDHYRVQKENRAAHHVASLVLRQDQNSVFNSHSVMHGGALVRNDVVALLEAEGVSCTLNGLYVVSGKQRVDNQMLVEHAKPHGYSHELYKGILDEEARANFLGKIHVHPGAQQTDAVQANRNLILSKGAIAHSNPQLEIFADDVKCTHGSTVGQLDPDAVFYLRSRGIGQEAARSILTYAFAADIVERIKVPALRTDLESFLFNLLPEGDVVRQMAI